ncbi:ferredoxin [Actinocorallia sp. API 0066]|uniref:ferredoxin n=1 Tax=Actinocorallia sp. API 0066 TaxID=2896846 RepID=UPI001E3049E2|nr:ferredoxin [Actinocorallia sp. API 0066]MCD0451608.1 ferredoxin [Actinocorallia sp. API 0066]
MKVTADRTRCMAAGHCAVTAPDVFDQADDGLVTVTDPTPPDPARADVLLAERLCPSRAVTVHDA